MCKQAKLSDPNLIFWLTLGLGILSAGIPAVQPSNILAIYTFPGRSHFMMHSAIIGSLIERGHNVTAITAFTMLPWKFGVNYTEILIDPIYNVWEVLDNFGVNGAYDGLSDVSTLQFIKMVNQMGYGSLEHALKQAPVQNIINANATENKYDLLLASECYQEAMLAVGYKYNIPIITVSTLGSLNYLSQMTAIITPWSFVPNVFSPYVDHMNFYERLMNSFYSLYEDLIREYSYLPAMNLLVDKYFTNLPAQRPTVSEMCKTISVFLLNSYDPLRTPRPTSNNMIDIGGVHIYPPKPLRQDFQQFLDEAEHGAIYFSLGTNVQSKDMPYETLKIFLDVFGSMKQRILWKFEDNRIQNLPKNIMIAKWMPQSDILAHPNVKVFITHGGLFGTQEGVYHAVPMLGIPFFSDQHLNIQKSVLSGYALKLNIKTINAENLRFALTELLQNTKYQNSIQHASKIFRDRPMNARELTVYWIEYVIRHKGATHLKSAGLKLNFIQFYLLDVIGFVILILSIIVISTIWLIKQLMKSRKQLTISKKLDTAKKNK